MLREALDRSTTAQSIAPPPTHYSLNPAVAESTYKVSLLSTVSR